MASLLEETNRAISRSWHVESDVAFVGSMDGRYRVSYSEFSKIADFEYDKLWGVVKIASDLIVYFRDGSYLFRKYEEPGDIDGSVEGWEYSPILSFDLSSPCKQQVVLAHNDSGHHTRTLHQLNAE